MSLYKKIDYTETINKLKGEIREYKNWANPTREFLMDFLNHAMEETMLAPDVDIDFKSVRSKYQTLKAIRDKMIKAEEEVNWREKEISKFEKII